MKKGLLGALALLFCLASGVQAQSDELNGFGIKAGLNLVTMHFSGGGGSSSPDRAGKPHFGLFYTHMLSENIAIQPELMYSGHGFDVPDGSFIEAIDFNYIAFPLMFKYYFDKKVNLHAGPELSFLIGGTEVNGVSVTDETKPINLGFAIGLEVFLIENVGLSGRYIADLSDIDDLSEEIEQRTSNIQFSLMYKF